MNKLAIIAALAAGGSLFAQSVSYGLSGQTINSSVGPQFMGSYTATFNAGVLAVSGNALYIQFVNGSNPPIPPTATLTANVSGPVSFSVSVQDVSNPSNHGWEGNEWTLIGQYNLGNSSSSSPFTIPSTPFTLTIKDGATTIGTAQFTIVPEPETYAAVAALGLVGFGLWTRRNTKA